MLIKTHQLKNKKGIEVHVTNYGGIITKIITPDRNGTFADITLGFNEASEYESNKSHPYFGALIGRYANRIARGRFRLDGNDYQLSINSGPHHLHGGHTGFDKVFWQVEQMDKQIHLSYRSKDGEEGYPGNLSVKVIYELTDGNELRIQYEATSDKPTPLNLTQHTYFNLTGMMGTTILDHELQIHADQYTKVDEELIPTGELINVTGTKFDFRSPRAIATGGYDHNFALRGELGELKPAATLYDPLTGRRLEIFTTEPGIQFYSGNFLEGSIIGKSGIPYRKFQGLCLETQHFPDSPNQREFPDTVLRPGNKYTSTTLYKFSVK